MSKVVIAPAIGRITITSPDLTLPPTIRTIHHAYRLSIPQIQDAEALRGADARETAAKIWQYIRDTVEYRRDMPHFEDIKTAAAVVSDGFGDCDDGTVLGAAIARHLGYTPTAYIVAQGDGDYSHIFLTIGDRPHPDNPAIIGYAIDFVPEISGPDCIAPNLTKIMPVRLIEGVTAQSGQIRGLAGLTNIDPLTAELMRRRDTILEARKAGIWDASAAAQLRIHLALIAMAGTPEQVELLPLVPQMQDITDAGVIVWANDADFDSIESHLNGLGGLGALFKKKPKAAAGQAAPPKKPAGEKLKNFVAATNRLNPGFIAIREATKAVIALNVFHLASRLRYLYIDPSDPKAKGLDPAFLAKFQANKGKVEAAFKLLGGDPANLKKAVEAGAAKGDRKGGIRGLGVVAESVTLATAAAGVATIVEAMGGPKALKDLGKGLKAAKIEDPAAQDDELSSEDTSGVGAKIKTFIQNVLKAGDKQNKGTAQDYGFKDEAQAQEAYDAAIGERPDLPPGDGTDGKKDNTIMYALGLAVLAALGYAATNSSK